MLFRKQKTYLSANTYFSEAELQQIEIYIQQNYTVACGITEPYTGPYQGQTFRPTLPDLDAQLNQLEESFSERLFFYIDLKEKDEVEIYTKATADRRLFSKIKSNKKYQPKKDTALLFALALELSYDETVHLLVSAGYSLSSSQIRDLIVEYFLKHCMYDIGALNSVLYERNLKILSTSRKSTL